MLSVHNRPPKIQAIAKQEFREDVRVNVSVLEALKPLRKSALLGIVGIIGIVVGLKINATYSTHLKPVQPIEFSHRIHAGENQIECLYCHSSADRSPSAGVPSVAKCVGCHERVVTVRDSAEIAKLNAYWQDQEPIPWIKVHDVPDFVHFTHKRHVLAGLECQQCHGPVETMDRIERVADLTMPWCTDCHTLNQTDNGLDCYTCHK